MLAATDGIPLFIEVMGVNEEHPLQRQKEHDGESHPQHPADRKRSSPAAASISQGRQAEDHVAGEKDGSGKRKQDSESDREQ